jgi:hypothetical protein
MITKETCGIALTSEQVMWFLEHPEEFEAFKTAHGVDDSQAGEGTEETAENAEGADAPEATDEQENGNPFPEEQ